MDVKKDGIAIHIPYSRVPSAGAASATVKISEIPPDKVLIVDEITIKNHTTGTGNVLVSVVDRTTNVDGTGATIDSEVVAPISLAPGESVTFDPKGGTKIIGEVYVVYDGDPFTLDIYGRLV